LDDVFKDPAGNTLALIYVLGSATVFLKFYLFAVRFAFAARDNRTEQMYANLSSRLLVSSLNGKCKELILGANRINRTDSEPELSILRNGWCSALPTSDRGSGLWQRFACRSRFPGGERVTAPIPVLHRK
jgi:hypothetical protein